MTDNRPTERLCERVEELESELECWKRSYCILQSHFDQTRERWMQRGAYIAKQEERIAELESLVRDMWPLVLLEFPHVTSVTNELLEMHDGLRDRMSALGLLEGGVE